MKKTKILGIILLFGLQICTYIMGSMIFMIQFMLIEVEFCNEWVFLSNLFISVDDFVSCIDVAIVEDSKDVLARSINSFSKQKVSKAVHVIVKCEFIFTTLENDKQMFKFRHIVVLNND